MGKPVMIPDELHTEFKTEASRRGLLIKEALSEAIKEKLTKWADDDVDKKPQLARPAKRRSKSLCDERLIDVNP